MKRSKRTKAIPGSSRAGPDLGDIPRLKAIGALTAFTKEVSAAGTTLGILQHLALQEVAVSLIARVQRDQRRHGGCAAAEATVGETTDVQGELRHDE